MFRRGRVFRPRCCLDLALSGHAATDNYTLIVDVTISNTGDTNVEFPSAGRSRVEVMVLDANQLEQTAEKDGSVLEWPIPPVALRDDVFSHNSIKDRSWNLEPSETVKRSAFFNLPTDWVVCKVRATLDGSTDRSLTWMTEKIATPEVLQSKSLERR